jgi:hypothetical protein
MLCLLFIVILTINLCDLCVIASPVNKEYQVLQGNINTLTFNLDDLWYSQNVSLTYERWEIASPVNKEYQALQGNINTLTFNLDDPWLSQNVSLIYNGWVIASQVNKDYHELPGKYLFLYKSSLKFDHYYFTTNGSLCLLYSIHLNATITMSMVWLNFDLFVS